MRRKHWFGIVSIILFAMSTISYFAPQIIPLLPCEAKTLPVERLSTGYLPSPGRYSFGAYAVLDSDTIVVGSFVRGNVTVYRYGMWTPRVWILGNFDYLHSGPGDLDKLSSHLAKFTIIGPCCTDLSYGPGYRVGFNFTSGETGSYHFLVQPDFAMFVVDILPSECQQPIWKNWLWLICGILGFIPIIAGFYDDRKRRHW
jgi:hypothetical protein